ncbi:MAG: excinuclease ABC subunit A, partial [Geminicoccaceae bacterium]|nr:excinuclease ABC subunit A [Geminicoccaceae bacterium]
NTVIVVEHDEDAIRAADHLIDMGPGAGVHGGQVVAAGTPDEVMANPSSLTGQYLTGRREVPIPAERRTPQGGRWLAIQGASANNLRGVDARFPLGCFVCVTGVSGSGKSSLVVDTLYPALARQLNGSRQHAGAFGRIEGMGHLDKVVDIDQSPI